MTTKKCARKFEHVWVKLETVEFKCGAKTIIFYCPICKGKRWV